MKLFTKISIAFLLVFSFLDVKGQSFIHFPDSTVWKIYSSCQDQQICSETKHLYYNYIEGDTIIHGKQYRKVLKKTLQYMNGCCDYSISYQGAIYEDTVSRKVYLKLPVADTLYDSLLYDYNWQIGDSIYSYLANYGTDYLGPTNPLEIYDIDTVFIRGKARKKWFSTGGWVIEGIGTMDGLINPHDQFYLANYFDCVCMRDSIGQLPIDFGYLDSGCTDSSFMLTSREEYRADKEQLELFPNPSSSNFSITNPSERPIQNIILYNLHGEIVLRKQNVQIKKQYSIHVSDLPKGLYMVEIEFVNATDKQWIKFLKQ